MRRGPGNIGLRVVAMIVVGLSVVTSSCSSGVKGVAATGERVEVTDPSGDMVPSQPEEGQPPGPDLRTVSLAVTDDEMTIAFSGHKAVDAFPPQRGSEGPSWFLQIWTLDESGGSSTEYLVGAFQPSGDGTRSLRGSDLKVLLCPSHTGCKEELGSGRVEISGKTVTIRVPTSAMPDLVLPFEWAASASWYAVPSDGIRWSDRAPDEGAVPDRVRYPSTSA